MSQEFRLIFDSIPEEFDRYRPRYNEAAFEALIRAGSIGPGCRVLEIGPGTGQATEPVLKTGCEYHAIELGKNFAARMREKFGSYENFHLVQDDFITHDFGKMRFDVIYSAATIQWIPEEIAYSRCFDLLKDGGVLAMMYMGSDYRTPNEALYQRIQQVYQAHWHPREHYSKKGFGYGNALQYGFSTLEKQEFKSRRVLDGDTYAALSGTHCDHIDIPEPHKTLFFDGLRDAVKAFGNKIEFLDTVTLWTAGKPE